MKKIFAILLALVMVCSMVACGSNSNGDNAENDNSNVAASGSENSDGGNSGSDAPAKNLQTVEMTVEAGGLEELTKVTISAPQNMSVKENDWNIVFTDEKQAVSVEAYLLCDYDCYDINQEYAKETYEGYGEQKFGDFDGYYYISESGYFVEVFVYLGCVAEMDDVYLSFSVSALEGEIDPMELFKLEDVQTIVSSAEFFPAQDPDAAE